MRKLQHEKQKQKLGRKKIEKSISKARARFKKRTQDQRVDINRKSLPLIMRKN